MIAIIIILVIMLIIAILGWRNERKFREYQFDALREEIKNEIHWAKFYKNEYTKRAEIEVYMRVLKIIREITGAK